MPTNKPKDMTTIAREIIVHGSEKIPFHKTKSLAYSSGGVDLTVHFKAGAEGFPLKVGVEVADKIQTNVSVECSDDVAEKIVGSDSKTKVQTRTLLKDSPLTNDSPAMHVFDRSGNSGFNLIVEASSKNTESLSIKFLLIVRPDDDRIISIPVLAGHDNKVPQFARRNPACFQRSA